MSTSRFKVVGMTCNGCVNKVTKALMDVDGVDDVDVDVADGTLEITGDADEVAVREAVEGVGYSIAR
ncbi:MAG TPA: heavy-metal-associated domain-containing protein [Candidatus Nanopelagicales bacterium]|nr:heavy-metal-associated domain-containing protein [Candidatus Nanopelagicales bacterium]